MILLAIDPGPTESAYALMDGDSIIRTGKAANYEVGLLFREGLRIRRAICERIRSYGMPAGAELFETCEWCGRFQQMALDQHIEWEWLTRGEVKMHLCHSMRAKDANIRAALIDRFGGPQSVRKGGPLYKVAGDVWSALAVSVTWWDQHAALTERVEG